jgi:hypothetical protein
MLAQHGPKGQDVRHTLEASNASDVARATYERLPQNTSQTAILLHEALFAIASEAGEARGYSAGVAAVTVHIPVDVVATALRRHRVTIWRAARQLKAAGLIDWRPHKTTLNGRTVNDGTLWCVALRPVEGGVRLSYEDMKHPGWRDLAGDIERGRTAYAVMQRSDNSLENELDLNLLREWTMPPLEIEKPRYMTVAPSERRDLETVLDVQHATRSERPAMVEAGADSLCTALRDPGGRRFYMALLWVLLRTQDATGAAPWYAVYEQARRARTDSVEGFARRPGALFTARLQAAGLYEAIAPPARRVGVRPIPA